MDTQAHAEAYLSLSNAARLAGRSVATLRRALVSPERPLPHLRVGLGAPRTRRIVIRRDDLIAWLEAQRVESSPQMAVGAHQ